MAALMAPGCALFSSPVETVVAADFSERIPQKVAVLPVANGTLYEEGPAMVREQASRMLESKGYDLVPAGQVDRLLKEKLGVVSGEQLAGIEPDALCEALGVDGLLYTSLTEWSRTRIVERDQVVVGADFRLRSRPGFPVIWLAKHEVFRHVEASSVFDNPERREDNRIYLALVRDLMTDVGATLPERPVPAGGAVNPAAGNVPAGIPAAVPADGPVQ